IRAQNWLYVLGHVQLRRSQPDQALARFDEAIAIAPDPERALVQAAALGNAGWPAHGVRHLDAYLELRRHINPSSRPGMPMVHRWLKQKLDYFEEEVRVLRGKLSQAAGEAGVHDNPAPSQVRL